MALEKEIEGRAAHSQRLLAWLAVVWMGFTLIGSFVPFEFRARPFVDAFGSFLWSMAHRLIVESRSDGIANVLLGIPLGFALLGWSCVDRALVKSRIAIQAIGVLVTCLAFAAAIEFLQLFVPARTCCGSDVLAQGLGAIIGMGAWLAFGQRLANEILAASTGSGSAGRFALSYLLLLGFIQTLPLDLSLSPYRVYHKFRDGGIRLAPFEEFRAASHDQLWAEAASLVNLAVLYIPLGLLAGHLPGRFWARDQAWRLALAAFALASAIELSQVLLASRIASATDVVVGVAGMFSGWRAARHCAGRVLSFGDLFVLGAGWLIAIGIITWHPFAFAHPVRPFDWMPGSPLEGGNVLIVLEEVLTKLVLFGLGGALVVSARVDRLGLRDLALAFGVGLAVAALGEVGQQSLSSHTPCITDVIVGGAGAAIGAWVAGNVRAGRAQPGGISCR